MLKALVVLGSMLATAAAQEAAAGAAGAAAPAAGAAGAKLPKEEFARQPWAASEHSIAVERELVSVLLVLMAVLLRVLLRVWLLALVLVVVVHAFGGTGGLIYARALELLAIIIVLRCARMLHLGVAVPH